MKYMKKSFEGMVPYHSTLLLDGCILNANESPFLPPKAVLEQIESIKPIAWNRYPDMDEVKLCDAIAKHYHVKKENVTVGVGSDELLDCMFRCVLEPNDIVLGFSPSFSMYQVFTELVGATYIPVYGDSNMLFSISDMIAAIQKNNPKLVLICTPNNPTGQFLSRSEVERIITSTDALIGLDLAYIDFAYEDYSDLALKYDNVICFKTFSKALALPSIRCGYALSKKDNIDMIDAIKAPYSVTSYTQEVATIAISNFDAYQEQINKIKLERERVYKELKSMGFMVYPSEANFLYVLMDDSYNERLLENKIYIRKFKSGVYRITIGTEEENNQVLEVLKNERSNS